MPTPYLHLPLAHQVAERLSLVPLPAVLWGAMAPDASWWRGRHRSETHFWTTQDDVSGALGLLDQFPELEAQSLTESERAFIAGYLCHLVTDEQWTLCLWRPYFGRFSPYGGSADGAALQNALRDVLDAREAGASPGTAALLSLLDAETLLRPDLLPFISTAELRTYRAAFLDQARTSPPDPTTALHAQAEEYVRRDSVTEFRQRAVDESVRLMGDYLAGRALRPPRGTADPGPATSAT